jgi:hypothetical protein
MKSISFQSTSPLPLSFQLTSPLPLSQGRGVKILIDRFLHPFSPREKGKGDEVKKNRRRKGIGQKVKKGMGDEASTQELSH